MNPHLNQIPAWQERFKDSSAEEILTFFCALFGDKINLSSSLGAEDQILTHMMAEISPETSVFTLDTGRLFPESYDLIDRTNARYKMKIRVFFPDYQEIEKMVADKGINLFYDSIENRKLCCHIRKIMALRRAFQHLDAWICGLRRDQSVTRTGLEKIEWDEANQLVKINPLADWNEEQVWDYIRQNKVPYNVLHDKGFPSIGCQPCTRAIQPGEDTRAGRWWWENPDSKECGLHARH
jgi:phosphoadenosine phosphosulfate reductase